jgi:glycosyltransferase involved in cell wall biosynthesis
MCLILPSRSEACSNVILEALSMGVPVIATGVGGTPDLVQSPEHGYLVPPDDPRALADAIALVVTLEEERSAMGRRAHGRAAAYRWPTAARMLVDEIEAVVGPRSSLRGRTGPRHLSG